jgi:hypothetical protein
MTMESIKHSLAQIREGLRLQGSDIPHGLPLEEWRPRMVFATAQIIYTDHTLTGDGTIGNPLSVQPGNIGQVYTDVTLTGDGSLVNPLSVPLIDGGTY